MLSHSINGLHHFFAAIMEIILKDVEDFDPKIWIYAVTISLSALFVLGLTLCMLMLRDYYIEMEEKRLRGKFHLFCLSNLLLYNLWNFHNVSLLVFNFK